MSNNKHLIENDADGEKSKSGESVRSFLDRREEEQYREDFKQFIDVLLRIIHPRASEKIYFFSNPTYRILNQRSIIFFIVVFSIISPLIVISNTVNLVLLLVGMQAIVIIGAFVSTLKDIIRLFFLAISNLKDKTETTFEKIMDEFVREQAAVKLLRNTITSEERLKLYEIEMDKQIRNTQINERVIYNVLLSVPILITFIVIYFYGEQAFKSFNDISLVSLKLPLVALYPIMVSMVNGLIFRAEIDKLNKCLSCIKKAQVKQDTQVPIVEKAGEKESFMSQIRTIKIDAPADFSTNYEKYM
jgi:ABC-type multidrug transport system fused ATPase/permease subunit